MTKTMIFGLGLAALLQAGFALEQLPSFKAPLKKTESAQEYTGAMQFDSKNLTFHRGSKKVVFQQDGTVCIYSGSQMLGKASLFISTPFKMYQYSKGINKNSGKYDGQGMQVREINTTADSLVINGMVPWNAPGDPLIALGWKIEAKIQNGKKVLIQVEYESPKTGKYRSDSGMFARFPGVQEFSAGKLGSWLPGEKVQIRSAKAAPIQLKFKNPADNFTLVPSGWRAWCLGSEQLRFDFVRTPGLAKMSIVIDLGKGFQENQIKNAFEVMKVMDDLVVPARGKNLIPNPYFAVPHRFSLPVDLEDNGKESSYSTDAKFGRYSWKRQGSHCALANIPLDAGDYVFSFYAKGKGRVTATVQTVGRGSTQHLRAKVNSPDKWTRYEFPFHQARESAVYIPLTIYQPGLLIDGIQLEKGKKATAFEAPAVEAGEAKEFFFRSGNDVTLEFELSTLEKAVSGTGEMSLKNFFGEIVAKQKFKYSVSAGKYPKIAFKLGKIPDGIYVVKLDYGGKAPEQFYRMAVMPFLKNSHQTAKAFALGYEGHMAIQDKIWEPYLARLQKIGVASKAHCRAMTPAVQKTFYKYGVVPFDLGIDGRGNNKILELMFPDLKNLPEGHMWSFIRDKSKFFRVKGGGLIPHYKLMGGWSEEYRKKFIEVVAKEIRRYPKYPAYYFASEGPHEVKDDKYYPDWFAAYREAVKSVYPDAWVYDGGEPGMGVYSGVAYTENLLRRLHGKVVSDFVNAHTYTKNLRELYPNFRGLVAMMKRNPEYADSKISLAEGMHFYPYHISRWNTEHICWNGEGWRGGAPSYDLGWHEKLSAAYYARSWLVFLTEFHRLWCACSSASNTRNFIMDSNLTPRAFQKIPNTLGVLLGNPKRYIGDFTFAPDTKCLVWEDEHGHPLAAIWNEDPIVDSGWKDAPMAKLDYSGAEFIDLMGVKRKTPEDGRFAVSPFPLFIRGEKGDFDRFTKALSAAVLDDPDRLPCHIGFEIMPGNQVKLTLVNQVARDLKGTLKIFGREHAFKIPRTGETSLLIDLPKPIRSDRVESIPIPYLCRIGSQTFSKQLDLHCFGVKKFTGDWSRIPSIRLNNKAGKNRSFTDRNFSASYQLAWDEQKMYLRVKVRDDVFSPGSKPGYRWTDDILQVFFDTRCSAIRTGKQGYDDDDYEYGFMPTADGKRCEVWRGISPDIQLTLGIAAPKNNTIATEIPAKFSRTKDGYIYEAEFPRDYLLPMKLEKGYNFAFGIYAADRDRGKTIENALSNATKPGAGCFNRPQFWPMAVLTE